MPFTILKLAKGPDEATEVIGEWDDEKEARTFAEDAMKCDPDHEYIVEPPPPHPDNSEGFKIH